MFSLILPGRPCFAPPTQLTETQFAFSFPTQPHFSHLVVFLLPGNALPDGTAAGVHLQFPGQAEFKFLGAIANEKQSAIFKCSVPDGVAGEVNLGISVEPAANIKGQLDRLEAQKGQLVRFNGGVGESGKVTTKVLAQRIIKHAFNFVSGFSGTLGQGGVEVVPLKAFEDWWRKFEGKIDRDPGFLERDES
jgi:protein Hikeshi